jgi:hypothetical protein
MSAPVFRVKAQMLSSGVVRAEYETEPMTLEQIRKQFENNNISPTNAKWEAPIPEGRQWDMKYVCELITEENQ